MSILKARLAFLSARIPSRGRSEPAPAQAGVWLADITDIPTGEGWLYLAVILDRFTRKIVGWAMREHMRAELTIAALTMAVQRRRPRAGLIHHADRGSQYAASDYRKILQAAAITPSMSRKPNCRDNAPMKSVFGTLKTKLVHQREYPDRDAARRDLFASIEASSIVGRSTPLSATSPQSRQTGKPNNPVSTFRGKVRSTFPPYRIDVAHKSTRHSTERQPVICRLRRRRSSSLRGRAQC